MVARTGIRRFTAVLAAAVLLVAGLATIGPSQATASPRASAPAAAAVPAGTFVPVAPVRVMDSIRNLGAGAPGPHAGTHLVTPAKLIPSTAVAVAATVSVIAPKAAGYLTVYDHAAARPATSNVVFAAGVNQANQVYVPGHGDMDIYNGSTGAVRILVDVTGYFAAAASAPAGAYVPVTPQRIVDTRNGVGGHAVAAHTTATVQLPVAAVPAGVSAVAVTLDALQPTAAGYLTAYATGTARPGTSNLNFAAKQSVADMVVVGVDSSARFTVYNGSAGSVQLVLDLQGYYRPGAPTAGGAYVPVAPVRILAGGPTGAQEAYSGDRNYNNYYPASVPGHATPLVTLTASGVQADGYAVLYPQSTFDRPSVETASLTRGLVTAGLTQATEPTQVFNGTNAPLRFTIDLSGYYLGPKGLGAIAGHVTDATSHAGLGGVIVVVYQVSSDDGDPLFFEYRRTTTAADGSYALTALDAGNGDAYVCFDAVAAAPQPNKATGYASQCYDQQPWTLPGRSLSGTGPLKNVPLAAGTTTTVDATLARTAVGTLSGQVSTNGGGGVADVLVKLDRTDGSWGADLHTDGSGHYSGEVPPGTYKVCFDTSAVADTAAAPYGYDTLCAASTATVTTGATTTKDQYLQELGAIAWPVTTNTGQPPFLTTVSILDSSGAPVKTATYPAYPDARTVAGLRPGTYTACEVNHSFGGEGTGYQYGFIYECYSGVPLPPDYSGTTPPPPGTTPVTVRPGALTRLPASVIPGAGAISGTVTIAGGAPAVFASVTVFNAAGTTFLSSGTDSDGNYLLAGIPPSTAGYTVCFAPSQSPPTTAKAQCYHGITWNGTSKPPAGTTSVRVTSGQTRTGIDAVLTG